MFGLRKVKATKAPNDDDLASPRGHLSAGNALKAIPGVTPAGAARLVRVWRYLWAIPRATGLAQAQLGQPRMLRGYTIIHALR